MREVEGISKTMARGAGERILQLQTSEKAMTGHMTKGRWLGAGVGLGRAGTGSAPNLFGSEKQSLWLNEELAGFHIPTRKLCMEVTSSYKKRECNLHTRRTQVRCMSGRFMEMG